MGDDVVPDIRLRYRDEFRSFYGDAFQNWFEGIAPALHGEGCFVAIRVTRGDGGLDGLVLNEGLVYQLYAPVHVASDRSMAVKLRADFAKARETLGGGLRAWTFLHNSPDGKIGHQTAAALLQLQEMHAGIKLEILGIDGLWDQLLAALPTATLAALFKVPIGTSDDAKRVREILRQAGELEGEGKLDEAFSAAQDALAIVSVREDLLDLKAETLACLTLLSSDRAGRGDRRHYVRLLEPLRDHIKDANVLLMTFRAQASVLARSENQAEAETVYLTALNVATQPENVDECAMGQCVIRAEYVHLLCDMGRCEDATPHLAFAQAYARQHPEKHDGDVLQLVLNAALHWAAETNNEDAALEAVRALEAAACTSRRAMKIAGALLNAANGLARRNCYAAALTAAEAALHLSEQCPEDRQRALMPGVLYAIAMIHHGAGRLVEAREKAKALVSLSATDETAPIRFAAAQLLSVISRDLGDFEEAVDQGTLAVGLAPETDSAFMAKMHLADSLADQGHTERALEIALDAHHLVEGRQRVPRDVQLRAIANVARLAAQLGRQDIVFRSTEKLVQLAGDDPQLVERRDRYLAVTEALLSIRTRMLDISLVDRGVPELTKELATVNEFRRFVLSGESKVADVTAPITSLCEANALTIAPVLRWWDDVDEGDYKAAALDYDYWGRGGFARILRNLQAFPHALNVAVEVRSVEDVRNALRLWTLYADFILLLWKGPIESGQFIHMIDGEWFGPWGAGYMLAMRDKYTSRSGRLRFPALAYGSWLPEDVARCLVTEARPFLASGRILLVPASGVGCVTPGHGVLEQLLTEVANCIPALRNRQESELQIGLLPYAKDIPLEILFDFVSGQENALLEMRHLILRKTEDVRKNGVHSSSRAMEREITEALRRLRQENTTIARRRQLSAAEQDARVGLAPFHLTGGSLVPRNDRTFAPLLTLESMGYGWKVGSPTPPSGAYRYEPAEGEAIGAWLAPPECGVGILTMTPVVDNAQESQLS